MCCARLAMRESSAIATLACTHTAECFSPYPIVCYVTPLDMPVLYFAQKAVRTGALGAALEDRVSTSCSIAAIAALQAYFRFCMSQPASAAVCLARIYNSKEKGRTSLGTVSKCWEQNLRRPFRAGGQPQESSCTVMQGPSSEIRASMDSCSNMSSHERSRLMVRDI